MNEKKRKIKICNLIGHKYICVIKTSMGFLDGYYTTNLKFPICKRCGEKLDY